MRMQGAGMLAAMVAGWLAGCASESPLGGTSHVGTVQGVYVEAYRGVFVDRALAADTRPAQTWAYVSFDRPLPDGRTVATAALPNHHMGIEPGDQVSVQLAHAGAFEGDALPERNLVTALVARRGDGRAAPAPAQLTRASAEPADR